MVLCILGQRLVCAKGTRTQALFPLGASSPCVRPIQFRAGLCTKGAAALMHSLHRGLTVLATCLNPVRGFWPQPRPRRSVCAAAAQCLTWPLTTRGPSPAYRLGVSTLLPVPGGPAHNLLAAATRPCVHLIYAATSTGFRPGRGSSLHYRPTARPTSLFGSSLRVPVLVLHAFA